MADLPTGRTFAAFLFDMDGTLLDSIDSANRAWSLWATRHGVDFEEMRQHMHGMRAVETIRRWGPAHLDVEAEYEALTIAEKIPMAKKGTVEVRPMIQISGLPEG